MLKKLCCARRESDSVRFYEAPHDHFGMGAVSSQFHNEPINVSVRTLDSVLTEERIERVDVLKVDVEGLKRVSRT